MSAQWSDLDYPISQTLDTLPLAYARETPARTARDLRTLAACCDELTQVFWAEPRDERNAMRYARMADALRARARMIEGGH